MGTYEWENCPYCGKRISNVRIGVASDTTIGQGLAKCPHCDGVFKTGKTEWTEKSSIQKTGYFVRVAWWCLGAFLFGGFGTIMAVLFFFILTGKNKTTSMETMLSYALPLGIIVAVLLVIKVIFSSKHEVDNSIKRTKR